MWYNEMCLEVCKMTCTSVIRGVFTHYQLMYSVYHQQYLDSEGKDPNNFEQDYLCFLGDSSRAVTSHVV